MRIAGPEDRHDDGQPHRDLGGGDRHHEEHDDLPVHRRRAPRPKATNARLAAFSISSIDMKITSGLRRTRTPTTPIVNRIADTRDVVPRGNRGHRRGLPPAGQGQGPHQGRQQQDRRHLEGDQVVGEQAPSDLRRRARRAPAARPPAPGTTVITDQTQDPGHRHRQAPRSGPADRDPSRPVPG